jgi:hypothetical protein
MDNGGREALLHYLLNFDLSQVDLRTIPQTAALLDQQIESMTPEQAWWFETLTRGVLPRHPYGDTGEPGVEPGVFLKRDLFELYIRYAQLRGVSHRSTETKIGTFLRKQLGAELKDTRLGIERSRCYALPPLQDCRRLFAEKLGQSVDWGAAEWASEEWQQIDTSWEWKIL